MVSNDLVLIQLLLGSILPTYSQVKDESSAISTAKLKRSLALHARPIEQLVLPRPYLVVQWGISSWGGLRT